MTEPQKQPTTEAAEAAKNQQITQIAQARGVPEDQVRQEIAAAQAMAKKDPVMATLLGMTDNLLANFNFMAGVVTQQAQRLNREDAAAGIAEDQWRTVPVADIKAVFDANAAVITALIALRQEQRATAESAAKQPKSAPAANSNNAGNAGVVANTGQYL
jgi:hypothetical protein